MHAAIELPMNASPLSLVALSFLLAGCGGGGSSRSSNVSPAPARLVSILVEVYDPITNAVWENVSVRVVEADQEWYGGVFASPYQDWFLTDAQGQVFLDEDLLALARVGFLEDDLGRAVLGPDTAEDEATVLLEVDAVGFSPVLVEVPLRWSQPDVFVQVPFN
jgi:hypothetical protein